jgi:integrase
VPLRQLTTERIQRASADLLAAGVPPATVRKALTLLQGMLERAVQWGRIANNPARYVRKPPNPPKRMTQPLSPRQVESLRRTLSKRKRLRDATLVSVLAYAGLRPGEALALRWRDIRGKAILVDKALSLGEERATKMRRNRSVRPLAPLATDLAKWRLASDRSSDDDLIFPTAAGNAWTEVDYHNWKRRHFKTAAAANGLDGVRVYDLRHSFASLLLAEQTNPAEIAAQLGHSLQVLFSTYAHVIEDFEGRVKCRLKTKSVMQ